MKWLWLYYWVFFSKNMIIITSNSYSFGTLLPGKWSIFINCLTVEGNQDLHSLHICLKTFLSNREYCILVGETAFVNYLQAVLALLRNLAIPGIQVWCALQRAKQSKGLLAKVQGICPVYGGNIGWTQTEGHSTGQMIKYSLIMLID